MSDFPGDDLLAEIAELWAQITERDDAIAELRAQVAERDATILSLRALRAERDAMIAEIIGDDNLKNQYLFQIVELRGRVAKHKATIAERDATIAELRAQVAKRDKLIAQVTKILGGYPDSDLLSLATTVAAGYERWCNGHDAQVDSLRAEIATLKERLSRCTCTDDYGDVAE